MKVNYLRELLLSLVLLMQTAGAQAAPKLLASFTDPAGDDNGDGTLVYPQRNDFQKGDLDLLKLNVSRDAEGYWFEATFRNPVRNPDKVLNTVTSEPLANFARNGFYQFNLDVYIDTDRVKDSGNILALPGRHVRIPSERAWEKAVILTPRPELMRGEFLDTLATQYPKLGESAIETALDAAVFFPTRIRVRGSSVRYFVPAAFFGKTDANDWAITAFVTGALTTISADLTLFPAATRPIDRLDLGVMQPAQGQPRDSFGYSGSQPSPVVDLLAVSKEQQIQQLAAMNDPTAPAWEPKIAGATIPASANIPPAVSSQQDAPEKAQDASSIAKRLQILQQLYDRKLIDENEYKQQRHRILNEL